MNPTHGSGWIVKFNLNERRLENVVNTTNDSWWMVHYGLRQVLK